MVSTNIPHTGLYIWLQGHLYSVGYGYSDTASYTPIKRGSLYSVDLILTTNAEARIVWMGILTHAILHRLQVEIDLVTHIEFRIIRQTIDGMPKNTVNREMDFIIPSRPYGGTRAAEANPAVWDCTKWAMYIVFGGIPANFSSFVGGGGVSVSSEILQEIIYLLRVTHSQAVTQRFIELLNVINHPFSMIEPFNNEWPTYLSVVPYIGGGGLRLNKRRIANPGAMRYKRLKRKNTKNIIKTRNARKTRNTCKKRN